MKILKRLQTIFELILFPLVLLYEVLLLVPLGHLIDRLERAGEKRFGRKKGDPVRHSLPTLWFGIVSTLLGIGAIIAMRIFPDEMATRSVYLSFSLFALVGIILTYISIREKIFIKSNHLIYRTLRWRTHKIPYRRLQGFERRKKHIFISTDTQEYKINIEGLIGLDELKELCLHHIERNKQYSSLYKGNT